VQDAGLAETRALVEAIGVSVTAAHLDVADRGAVHAWADRVVSDHGRVNVVVNNAGVGLGALVDEMTYDDLEWLMNINFWGVVHGTKAFLPHLKRAGDGHVVNVSSVFGIIGVPTQSAYNAAKFAVRGFTEALREELDLDPCGVSCTSVHPGGIRTNIARSSRIGGLGPLTRSREEMAAEFERLARTTPEAAAEAILAGIRRDRRRVLIGTDAYLIDGMQRLLPTAYQRLVAAVVRRQRWPAGGQPA
jgi:short-subunit dehydrogenase